jgi:hypothetical protein
VNAAANAAAPVNTVETRFDFLDLGLLARALIGVIPFLGE